MVRRKEAAATGACGFAGPPRRLHWAAGEAAEKVERLELAPDLQAHLEPERAAFRARRDLARSRLRLGPLTPPGEYRAIAHLAGGDTRELQVRVEPFRRVRVAPSKLVLSGPPGAVMHALLHLENVGNVDTEIEGSLVTGVFDNRGIETALASTYRLETDDVNRLIGNLIGRLRESHGGLLRFKVVEGAGTLKPGERRTLKLELLLSSTLKPGHSYHGMLHVCGRRVALAVETPPGEAR